MRGRPYLKLGVLMLAVVVVVLALRHVMAAETAHIRFSPHHLYMALMVMSPLGVMMLFLLGELFRDRRVNLALTGVFALVFAGAFLGQRTQAGVGDEAALAALIGHHSHTLHVCAEAHLTDPRVIALCERLTALHRRDIAEMHALLGEG